MKKWKRQDFIRGIWLALGISVGGVSAIGGQKLLEAGKNNSSKQTIEDSSQMPSQDINIAPLKQQNQTQRDAFMERLSAGEAKNQYQKVDMYNSPIIPKEMNKAKEDENQPVTQDEVMNEIIKEYNEINGTNITEYSFMKTSPSWLGIKNDGTYVQDYKEQVDFNTVTYNVGPIYNVVDYERGKIIASIGVADGQIRNIYSNVIMRGKDKKEFIHADNEVDLQNLNLDKERLNQSKLNVIYGTISSRTERLNQDIKNREQMIKNNKRDDRDIDR